MKKILILGGGPGGAVAANYLARRLGRDEAEITLIDKTGYHLYPPSLLWVMTGIREVDDIRRPLNLLEKKGVKVVVDEVTRILPEENAVETANGRYEYDYLIVALGSIPRPDKMEGWEHVCAPWTIEGALKCREMLSKFRGGDIVIGIHSQPYKCPPAPFEAAFMLRYIAEQRGVLEKTRITVFHEWSKPMEPFGPFMTSAFQVFLDQFGIRFIGGVRPEEITSDRIKLSSGEELRHDFAIVVPPHEPPAPVAESELAKPDTGGYMDVELKTLRNPKYRNVFGVGDVISPTLGLGMAGVFAHFQAEYVSTQIIDEIRGTYSGEHYNMSGVCVMDMGYMGAAVYCDFSPKLLGQKPYPDCYMLGGMRLFRAVKEAFEAFWFARLFG